LILAAHSARTQARIKSSALAMESLRGWVEKNLDLDGCRQVAQRASVLGASEVARMLLDPEIVAVPDDADSVSAASSEAWARTAATGHSILSTAANAIERDGLWRSRRFLAAAMWPSRRDIDLSLGMHVGLWGRARYRSARLMRGLRLWRSSLGKRHTKHRTSDLDRGWGQRR